MTVTVTTAEAESALKVISNVSLASVEAAFRTADVQTTIATAGLTAVDILQIIGLIDPPVAIYANDAQALLTIEKLVGPLFVYLRQKLGLPPSGQFTAFNQPFTSTLTQG